MPVMGSARGAQVWRSAIEFEALVDHIDQLVRLELGEEVVAADLLHHGLVETAGQRGVQQP